LRVLSLSGATNSIKCHTFTDSIDTMIEANFTLLKPIENTSDIFIS